MKKIKFFIMTASMLLLFSPNQLRAENETSTISNTESTKSNSITKTDAVELAESNAQLARLEEIKSMDMSTLSKSEKKELCEEVKSIDMDQQRWGRRGHGRHGHDDFNGRGDYHRHRHGGGVFILGGSGIIILLLLILLL